MIVFNFISKCKNHCMLQFQNMAITLGYGCGITLCYILIPYALSGELETIQNSKRKLLQK